MFEIKPIISALLRQKTRSLLLIAQIAISLAIVSNALHVIVDKSKKINASSGIPESEIVAVSVYHYTKDLDKTLQYQMDEDMLNQRPEIISASITNMYPYSDNSRSVAFSTEPDAPATDDYRTVAGFYEVSEHFIDAMGLKMAEGRFFNEDEVNWEAEGTQAMPLVITKAYADVLFPNGNALGQAIYWRDAPNTIIGIVEKLHNPYHYMDGWVETSVLSVQTNTKDISSRQFVMRVSPENVEFVKKNLEGWLLENYQDRVISNVHTISEARHNALTNERAMIKVLSVIISVLLIITALAIVGMTSFNVAQRTKQIGTRRALGATKTAIVRYFLTENSILSVTGLSLGFFASLALHAEFTKHFNVSHLGWQFLAFTAVLILSIGLISAFFPALKAAKIPPATATR